MSEIRATTISDLAGTGPATLTGQYAAKAWVNFNGTGTVAIRESANVSSITDNSLGVYTVNFANAMTDANYSGGTLGGDINGGGASDNTVICTANQTTSSVRVLTRNVQSSGGVLDPNFASLAIFR